MKKINPPESPLLKVVVTMGAFEKGKVIVISLSVNPTMFIECYAFQAFLALLTIPFCRQYL